MKIAIHQPNFIPWFPFFYKMAMVDIFILYDHTMFEKNGYQNRFRYKDKWITKPVVNKTELIHDKDYVHLPTEDHSVAGNPLHGEKFPYGGSVKQLNHKWIEVIKDTLDIKTKIAVTGACPISDSKTGKLINMLKGYGSDVTYITNPEAKEKYLDESMMKDVGINIEYCLIPNNLKKSTFEIIEEFGIEGAKNQLPKREVLCAV